VPSFHPLRVPQITARDISNRVSEAYPGLAKLTPLSRHSLGNGTNKLVNTFPLQEIQVPFIYQSSLTAPLWSGSVLPRCTTGILLEQLTEILRIVPAADPLSDFINLVILVLGQEGFGSFHTFPVQICGKLHTGLFLKLSAHIIGTQKNMLLGYIFQGEILIHIMLINIADQLLNFRFHFVTEVQILLLAAADLGNFLDCSDQFIVITRLEEIMPDTVMHRLPGIAELIISGEFRPE